MDADLIKSILSVVAASIPLIIAIFALVRSQANRTTEPNDNPLIKVLKIKREPVEQKYWKHYKLLQYIKGALWAIPSYIIYTLIFLFTINQIKNFIVTLIIILSFGIAFTWVSHLTNKLLSHNYIFAIKSAYQGRYFLFQGIYIEIEADYHYLFNKCHEALKSLGYPVVEIDADSGVLEACFSRYHYSANDKDAGLIKIVINRNNEKSNKFIISINVEMFSPTLTLDILISFSKLANRFVDKLISKPKDAQDKFKEAS